MYEHRVFEHNSRPAGEDLDTLDADGWKVISILSEHGRYYIYTRRPHQSGVQ